ncbi:uncharacterized protein [Triticum aestivum]|uniref:uncharacterized protein isoform X2 n=1 Tax=Triticum aestivum TaxID=4565 RepID=UPI001D0098AD|nr:uncharacterized protein LOC123136408 isoform X2 [Triticum aestivum]
MASGAWALALLRRQSSLRSASLVANSARGTRCFTPSVIISPFESASGSSFQGSSIQMTGPKRAIELVSPVLIEFDMRIKNGGQEEEDLQLIDGAISCHDRRSWKPVKHRIKGNCGAVDMSFACVEQAVEATIEVVISEVHSSFSLSLRSFVMFWKTTKKLSFSMALLINRVA